MNRRHGSKTRVGLTVSMTGHDLPGVIVKYIAGSDMYVIKDDYDNIMPYKHVPARECSLITTFVEGRDEEFYKNAFRNPEGWNKDEWRKALKRHNIKEEEFFSGTAEKLWEAYSEEDRKEFKINCDWRTKWQS